jgi:hypothetical protein
VNDIVAPVDVMLVAAFVVTVIGAAGGVVMSQLITSPDTPSEYGC